MLFIINNLKGIIWQESVGKIRFI